MEETDFRKILVLEEEYIKVMCDDIIALKPDIVFTGSFYRIFEQSVQLWSFKMLEPV